MRSVKTLEGFCFLAELPARSVRMDGSGTDPFVPGGWTQLARTGTFFSPVYGKIELTPDDLRTMFDNFKTRTPLSPTLLPIDFDHLSDEPQKPGDGQAAGWITDMKLGADGQSLWMKPKWTRDAAQMISDGKYAGISPFFVTDFLDKATGKKIGPTLRAAAITNRPFLEGMENIPAPTIAASERLARKLWKHDSVALPQHVARHSLVPSRQQPRDSGAHAAAGRALQEQKGAQGMSKKQCAHCGAPSAKADGTVIKWSEELAEKPGGITCPHCGAPVKHVGMEAPKPEDGGKEAGDAEAEGAGAEGLEEGGGDADALEELGDAEAEGDELAEDPSDADGDAGADDALHNVQEKIDASDDEAELDDAAAELDEEVAAGGTKMAGVKPVMKPGAAKPVVKPAAPAAAMSDRARKPAERALREDVRRLSEKNAETEAALHRIQRRERRLQAERLVRRGLREGKLTGKLVGSWKKPGWALAEAYRRPTEFSRWLSSTAPVIVDLTERGTGKEQAGDKVAATAAQMHELAMSEMAKDAHLTYADAIRKVNTTNRALAETYDRQMSGTAPRVEQQESAASNIR